MKKVMKKVMGKPMKAQKGKKAPMYDDDANDRLMADTYAEYMREKQAAERAKAKPKPAPKALPKPTKTVAKPMKSMKMGGTMKKAKDGSAFAKLAPPYDKATYADKIAGATKGKAKSGTKMKKAMMGSDMMQSPMMQSPMMKKGGAMKKCKYGCK